MATLVQAAEGDEDDGVSRFARVLLGRVEDLEMTLEKAKDQLIVFRRRKMWVDELERLLLRREAQLPISDFDGSGNCRAALEAALRSTKHIRTIVLGGTA